MYVCDDTVDYVKCYYDTTFEFLHQFLANQLLICLLSSELHKRLCLLTGALSKTHNIL